MSYPSNNPPAQNNITSLPLCSAKEPWWGLALFAITSCLLICGATGYFLHMNASYVVKIMLIVLVPFVMYWGLRFAFLSFYLYPDRIVIKHPFSFTSKADEIFQLSALEKVVFSRKTAKVWIIFRTNGQDHEYEFIRNKADEFITHLTRLGVNTEKERNVDYMF